MLVYEKCKKVAQNSKYKYYVAKTQDPKDLYIVIMYHIDTQSVSISNFHNTRKRALDYAIFAVNFDVMLGAKDIKIFERGENK